MSGSDRLLVANELIRTAQLPPCPWVLPEPDLAPPASQPNEGDLLGIGADLEPSTLISAYCLGLFPMPVGRRRQIGWFSPDPRCVIDLDAFSPSRSLRRSVQRYEIRTDTCFQRVVLACADPTRAHGWITTAILKAYTNLHHLGFAHSVEVFRDDELVGGLYGVRIKGLFAGESMFHRAPDASKVALVHLVSSLRESEGQLLDGQWLTPHLESLGATALPRSRYLQLLAAALR